MPTGAFQRHPWQIFGHTHGVSNNPLLGGLDWKVHYSTSSPEIPVLCLCTTLLQFLHDDPNVRQHIQAVGSLPDKILALCHQDNTLSQTHQGKGI